MVPTYSVTLQLRPLKKRGLRVYSRASNIHDKNYSIHFYLYLYLYQQHYKLKKNASSGDIGQQI